MHVDIILMKIMHICHAKNKLTIIFTFYLLYYIYVDKLKLTIETVFLFKFFKTICLHFHIILITIMQICNAKKKSILYYSYVICCAEFICITVFSPPVIMY